MEPIRYAVVGLGHIAQEAVLPAFAHAKNSRLTAFVSGDPVKLAKLAKRYGVENNFSYEDYDDLLASRIIDAVYIALPNSMHHEFALRALERGVHVLCEKPLTTASRDAEELVEAAEDGSALLMTAYRLHFDRANLEAAEIVRSGKIGEPRFFNSSFSLQLAQGNIRADRSLGGGPLYDLGVYCINAARYFFREEPEEVFAFSSRGHDRRFAEVDEMTSAILRFPDGKLAQFACSFGASPVTWCEVVGTKGSLCLTNSYEYTEDMELEVTLESGKTESRTFARRDQFAPELVHFSECIQKGRKPEPDGREGLADVRVIEALLASARSGRPQRLRLPAKTRRPTLRQEIRRRPVRKPSLIRVHPASRD
jgi:predicted dehydrogenase